MENPTTDIRNEPATGLPGQEVLPDLVALFGYDSIELKTEHELFVRRLIALGNATDAYLEVYPKVSRSVARRAASRLLTNDDIRKRFQQVKQEIAKKAQYSAEDAYRELVNIVECDRKRLYDPDGKLKSVHELDDDVAKLIDGIEETHSAMGGKRIKVLLPKRLDALDKIFRYHGAYKDKLEHSGPNGGPVDHRHTLTDEMLEAIALGKAQ